jgi:hypothetical protein
MACGVVVSPVGGERRFGARRKAPDGVSDYYIQLLAGSGKKPYGFSVKFRRVAGHDVLGDFPEARCDVLGV